MNEKRLEKVLSMFKKVSEIQVKVKKVEDEGIALDKEYEKVCVRMDNMVVNTDKAQRAHDKLDKKAEQIARKSDRVWEKYSDLEENVNVLAKDAALLCLGYQRVKEK